MGHIFRSNTAGGLEFVGDFDALYLSDPDPWAQASKVESPMSSFYSVTRRRLGEFLGRAVDVHASLCEVGCGNGHSTILLRACLEAREVAGCDISLEAIKIAVQQQSKCTFFHHDILSGPLQVPVNVLILSHLLWYVLHDIDKFVENCLASVTPLGGYSHIILHQALFKGDQKYGIEHVSSPGTFIDLFLSKLRNQLKTKFIISAEFMTKDEMPYDWFLCDIVIPADL